MAVDKIGAVYVWIAIIVVFSIWVPETFPTADTAKQILNSNAITGLAALAITIPLAARVFDLSFAFIMTLTGVVVAKLVIGDTPLVLAVLIGLGVGLAIGLINAVRRRARQDRLVHRDARHRLADPGADHDGHRRHADQRRQAVRRLLRHRADHIAGITLPVFYFAIVAIAIWYLLEHTATGRRLYAPGSTRTRRGSRASRSTSSASCRS